ncbi:hypothetical protein AHF37_02498 [Paragonimus kellicotti]|nr:hypothetical protein AHF37_02498 [Paragonimus kellicotti]
MDAQSRRNKLIEQIVDWNACRLDLFELSMPDEKGEFNGVMRFFYQDEYKRYQTKCVRVSSTDKTSHVVEVLQEKFFLTDSSAKRMRFGIYEHYANGVRRLTNDEYPLLVQLNWSKLDREGKFVLKAESAGDNAQAMNGSMRRPGSSSSSTITTNGGNGRIRRRWSLRKDKQISPCSRRGPLGCAAAVGWAKDKPIGRARQSFFDPKLNCLVMSQHSVGSTSKKPSSTSPPPPDSSFTRTISNPEQVMQRKRQRTLEAKLLEILQHGGPNIGGTLKIYGGHICPQVPYKTLLLSVTDTVADVIRQSLDKYGMEEADADAYCLVLRVRTTADTAEGRSGTERVLADTDFPLAHLFASTPEAGSVVTFEVGICYVLVTLFVRLTFPAR